MTTNKKRAIESVYQLLEKAQNMVVGTNLEDLYFDYLYYQMKPLDQGYEPAIDDLEDLHKSAQAIIKMSKLSKDVKQIYG